MTRSTLVRRRTGGDRGHGDCKPASNSYVLTCSSVRVGHSIWEKKYGQNANHVKLQQATDRNPYDKSRQSFGKPQGSHKSRPQPLAAGAPRPQFLSQPQSMWQPHHRIMNEELIDVSIARAPCKERGETVTSILGGKEKAKGKAEPDDRRSTGEENSILAYTYYFLYFMSHDCGHDTSVILECLSGVPTRTLLYGRQCAMREKTMPWALLHTVPKCCSRCRSALSSLLHLFSTHYGCGPTA